MGGKNGRRMPAVSSKSAQITLSETFWNSSVVTAVQILGWNYLTWKAEHMEFVNICSLPLLLVAQLIQFKHIFIPSAGWPCSFQGWLDLTSAAPVLPSEWQLLTFQTPVNCRIQFRKHPVSLPVSREPWHLNSCLSWGSLQLLDDLQLCLVLQVSAIHWQFTCFVTEFQCKMPFLLCMYRKLYLLKFLSSLSPLTVENLIFLSQSIFQVSFVCFSKRKKATTKNVWIAFYLTLQKFHPSQICLFFSNFPFFLLFILLLIQWKYGTK